MRSKLLALCWVESCWWKDEIESCTGNRVLDKQRCAPCWQTPESGPVLMRRSVVAQLARASQALPASCTIQRSWLRRVPSPAGANITRSLCTDQALKKVLDDVARRVSGADPTATALPPDTALPPGATLTSGPKMILRFTCTHEGPTSPPPGTERTHSRTISKRSYEEGVVLVRCGCCNRPHLIADNLGWFGDKNENIESILAERGEEVQRICGARA